LRQVFDLPQKHQYWRQYTPNITFSDGFELPERAAVTVAGWYRFRSVPTKEIANAQRNLAASTAENPSPVVKKLNLRGVAQGKFPKPIRLGTRAVGWLAADVDAWIRQQVEISGSSK
jgi:hypothetical protein